MREYKIVEQHVVVQRKVGAVVVTCSICEKEQGMGNVHGHKVGWRGGHSFQSFETAVYMVGGDSYPEGDFREVERFDVCPKCWTQHLAPFLRGLGAEPEAFQAESGPDTGLDGVRG